MESFEWGPPFETGLADVDKQHQKLVEIVNRFGRLILDDRVGEEDVTEVFRELADYATYHFTEERQLMTESGIDSRHQNRHVESHERFLEQVTLMATSQQGAYRKTARGLFAFLVHWLAYHILGSDQNMAQQIAAVTAGALPEEAYDASEREVDSATAPLLRSLEGLFELLSVRNKELEQLNLSLEQKVGERTEELAKANQALEELALTDVLTSLPNRRHAMRFLTTAWEEAEGDGLSLSCLMIDADDFKRINDSYGHDAGDVVLHELAKRLRNCARSDDLVCRLGGDEFLIVCRETDLQGAHHLGKQVQEGVAELRVAAGGGIWKGSVSIGVACRSPEMDRPEALLKVADNGVYRAKTDGRNCVRIA